jgi:pyruvate dehydrogenase E2 component (dihydrolipoyllysine-residue acetyltransferase)
MSDDILMPRLSDGMEEGTILQWLKAEGDEVRAGDELVEIETDKANMVYESPRDGVLHIAADEGETLPVGERIATISAPSASTSGVTPAEPLAPAGSDPPVAAAVSVVAADPARGPSPVESGRNGHSPRGEVVTEELSRLQTAVARRMAQSKSTVPDFVLTVEVDMQAVGKLRAKLKADGDGDETPSINDFIVKAAALALAEFPRANGAYRDGQFERYSRINVGIAVAGQDALVVPTIFDADQKHLQQIATEARAAAHRVRSAAITEPELSGGTFTVSNLGMFGIDDFVAIINQPQAAILAVGAMKDTPVVCDGTVVIRPVLRLTLTCDHRILYGADAAGFLGRIRQRLENPSELVG